MGAAGAFNARSLVDGARVMPAAGLGIGAAFDGLVAADPVRHQPAPPLEAAGKGSQMRVYRFIPALLILLVVLLVISGCGGKGGGY